MEAQVVLMMVFSSSVYQKGRGDTIFRYEFQALSKFNLIMSVCSQVRGGIDRPTQNTVSTDRTFLYLVILCSFNFF